MARALSSVGRALLSQSRSHRFKSCSAHINAATRASGLRLNFMRTLKCAVVACVCAWGTAVGADDAGPGISGEIVEDTIWAGDVYLAGDLYIAPGATLTLEPGTRVEVAEWDRLSRSFSRSGSSHRVEIVVAGRLKADGHRGAPVIFFPDPRAPDAEAWAGLELKGEGAVDVKNTWFVGMQRRLPDKGVWGPGVFRVTATRESDGSRWPYRGENPSGSKMYLYPDGSPISDNIVYENRGYSRWIIAPAMAAAFIPLSMLAAMGPGFGGHEGEATAIMVIGPPLGFGLGFVIGWGIDTDWGVRRSQNKWLQEHPDFAPPF